MEHLRRVSASKRASAAVPQQAAWQEGMDRLQWVEGLGQRAVVGGLSGTNPFVAAWDGGPINPDRGGGLSYTHAFESQLLGGYDVRKLPEPVQFALDLVTQTATDPITYVPGADLIVLASKAAKLAKAIKLLGEASQKVPQLKRVVDRAAPMLQHMTASLPGRVAGKVLRGAGATLDVVTGARAARHIGNQVIGRPVRAGARAASRVLNEKVLPNVDRGYALRQHAGRYAERRVSRDVIMAQARHDQRIGEYDGLLKKWAKFMDHTGSVPMPVRKELDRLSYLLGTKEVRNEAIRHGFRPSTEERASPIVNRITKYEVHYEPLQKTRPAPGEPPIIQVRPGGFAKGTARFDMPQTVGHQPLAPLSQRIHERLHEESRDLRNHSAAMRSMQNYGLLGSKVNTFRTAGGKRVVDTERGPRFSGRSTLAGRTKDAVAAYKAALEAGDTKRAGRYASLVSKQNLLAGGASKIDQNVGEINLTKEQAERQAIKTTIEKGLGGKERALRKGKLTAREKLSPMKQEVRMKQMHTTKLQNLARKALQGAEKTQAVGEKQANRLSRLLTERNADFRGTLRTVRDKTRAAVLGKPQVLGDNGPIFGLPGLAPVTKRQKLTREQQKIVSPSEVAHNQYSWTESQGQGAHVKSLRKLVGKPSKKVADRVKALALKQHAMMMTAAKKHDAALEANAFRESVQKEAKEQLDTDNTVGMPKSLQDRIYNMDPIVKNNWLTELAQVGRDMMFITSTPHKLNVGSLAMGTEPGNALPLSATAAGIGKIIQGNRQGKLLRNTAEAATGSLKPKFLRKGGKAPSGVAALQEQYLKGSSTPTLSPERQQAYNALQKAKAHLASSKAKSDPVEESLINVGAPVKYSRRGTGFGSAEESPAYKRGWLMHMPKGPQLADWLEKRSNQSSDSLHRYETGLRSAELAKLKKRGVLDPVTQGGEIRDAYGNYYERSNLVRYLQDQWGAPFAQYRAGVIPRAGAKALTQRPRAIHETLNAIRDFNYDVAEPTWGGDIRPGGSLLTEWSEILGRPQHYAMSASTVGPASTAASWRDKSNPAVARSLVNATADYQIPGAPQVKSLVNSKDHKLLRLLLSTGGWDLEPVKQRAPYYPPAYSPR